MLHARSRQKRVWPSEKKQAQGQREQLVQVLGRMRWFARVWFGDEPRKGGSTRAGDAREMTNAVVVLVEGCKEEIPRQ